MSLGIYVVDAFTIDGNKPFTGNPAAVCLLEYDDDINDELKQKIATEMNLSETAFVAKGWNSGDKLSDDPDGKIVRRTLRWFTPATEVALCGHATVASAKVLSHVQFGGKSDVKIEFESKFSGKLGAVLSPEGLITLDFPSNPTHSMDKSEYSWLDKLIPNILGKEMEASVVADIQYSPKTKIVLIRLKDELGADGLRNVTPNFQALMEIDAGNTLRDCIVTVKGNGDKGKPDFYSRFFAPWDGIDEDPVTGLAHTVLTPYWTKEMKKDGEELYARQHSTRGGDLKCTLLPGDRVKLSGTARLGLEGKIHF